MCQHQDGSQYVLIYKTFVIVNTLMTESQCICLDESGKIWCHMMVSKTIIKNLMVICYYIIPRSFCVDGAIHLKTQTQIRMHLRQYFSSYIQRWIIVRCSHMLDVQSYRPEDEHAKLVYTTDIHWHCTI